MAGTGIVAGTFAIGRTIPKEMRSYARSKPIRPQFARQAVNARAWGPWTRGDLGSGMDFVVVSRPRSGSNMLVDVLDQHPAVRCFGELMHPHMISYGIDPARGEITEADPGALQARAARPVAFLRAQAARSGAARVGFKHILEHDETLVARFAADPGLRIVLLTRRDALAEFRSRVRALRTGEWFSIPAAQGGCGGAAEPLALRGRDFMTFFELRRQELLRAEAALAPAEAAGRVLRVFYEDLERGGTARGQVWAFLGLSADGAGELAARTRVQRRSPARYRRDMFYRALETAYTALGEHGFRRALDRGRRIRSALR